ncbi:SH3 domain-containing C40 family peptidase [Chitinasiproducens palmae]|nr:SH3 domain-containing C40 family peptidase [Chitinasiproducens palmae]
MRWLAASRVAALLAAATLAGCAQTDGSMRSTGAPSPHRTPASGPRAAGASVPLSLFPLDDVPTAVSDVLPENASDRDAPLVPLDTQLRWRDALVARYVGTEADDGSPWLAETVEHGGGMLASVRLRAKVARYGNAGKSARRIGYGENFRPHDQAWIERIAANMRIDALAAARGARFEPARRAITVDNAPLRDLPTDDPHFYDFQLPGEGYPFDNLQVSALRPATPVYRVSESADRQWTYVLAPEAEGWVHSTTLADADPAFVRQWRAALRARPAAPLAASVALSDEAGRFRFAAPLGTLLPMLAASSGDATATVLLPVADADGRAVVRRARLAAADIAAVPWPATRAHFARLIGTLAGRPYGWGNANGYNDCSAELRSLLLPFGLWLPRHSSAQVDALHVVDLSHATPAARLAALRRNGQALLTLIDIGGHVMLYLGEADDHGVRTPFVYQNVWGLAPADGSRRAVIGMGLVFPLHPDVPGHPTLQSLAARKRFRLGLLVAPSGTARPNAAAPPAVGASLDAAQADDAATGQPGNPAEGH